MPELPEVETIVRQLDRQLKNKKIIGVRVAQEKLIKNVSAREFIKALTGRTIKKISRRAKLLVFHLNGLTMLAHLKMSGRLLYLKPEAPMVKHTHIIFKLSDGHELRYWDQRRFGAIKIFRSTAEKIPELKTFGPEPVAADFTFEKFRALFAKKKKAVKPLLMDPTFIAGIGNIYADEILHYAGVHPLRPAAGLNKLELLKMYQGLKKILNKSIALRGTSFDLYQDSSGKEGGYLKYLRVYGRAGKKCLKKCGGQISRQKIGSRSAHFCPVCQK